MKPDLSIKSLLTERAAQENMITGYQVTDSTITIHLKPKVAKVYERPDCREPVEVERHASEILTIQGLGLPGKALRYHVQSIRLGYLNDVGKFTTFSVPLPDIRTHVLVTAEVIDKMLYPNVDRNLPLPVVVEMLRDLYQVEQIVLFRQQVRTIFNDCDTFALALDHLAVLKLDGWTDLLSLAPDH